jgi:hypothetical protein
MNPEENPWEGQKSYELLIKKLDGSEPFLGSDFQGMVTTYTDRSLMNAAEDEVSPNGITGQRYKERLETSVEDMRYITNTLEKIVALNELHGPNFLSESFKIVEFRDNMIILTSSLEEQIQRMPEVFCEEDLNKYISVPNGRTTANIEFSRAEAVLKQLEPYLN